MSKLSVIIPSRDCKFASKTVEDIFAKARGEIEVIIVLDNWWPHPPLKEHKNLIVVHKGTATGLRKSVNIGVQIATGEWIMKCDDHCMFGEGFDEILKKDMEWDWLCNPSRYALDAANWERGRGPTEYLYITFPYVEDNQFGNGLHGKKWWGPRYPDPANPGAFGAGLNSGFQQFYYREIHEKDKRVDDLQTFQGSFWMMSKKKYLQVGGLDEKMCDLMENEPQELGFKVWLSGGRCIVNKNTWYAHMHKNEQPRDVNGRTWKLSYKAMRETGRFQTWYWMNNKWPLRARDIEWFVDHFWPIPSWPENWQEERAKYNREKPEMNRNFRIFDPNGISSLPFDKEG